MVYCSRCGTQNLNTNVHCINCGVPLYTVGERYPGSDREQYRKMEDECFGLPNGGMIAAFINRHNRITRRFRLINRNIFWYID